MNLSERLHGQYRLWVGQIHTHERQEFLGWPCTAWCSGLARDGTVIHLTCLRRSGFAQAGVWPEEALERGLSGPLAKRGKNWGRARADGCLTKESGTFILAMKQKAEGRRKLVRSIKQQIGSSGQ